MWKLSIFSFATNHHFQPCTFNYSPVHRSKVLKEHFRQRSDLFLFFMFPKWVVQCYGKEVRMVSRQLFCLFLFPERWRSKITFLLSIDPSQVGCKQESIYRPGCLGKKERHSGTVFRGVETHISLILFPHLFVVSFFHKMKLLIEWS